jgi:asparagine synthase (glutamine-hydrolysing)
MSGLCGIVDFTGRAVPVASLEPMTDAAPYRGRDGVTTWSGPGIAFAYQRMCVTPESRHERQPLVDPNGAHVLMADARLDDREALVATLGSLRADAGDGELLAAAVETWGEAGVGRLLGDFAFVSWDPRRRRLFAARDAMGMRPLIYRWDAGRLWFASEVQQVLAADGVAARLFAPAIAAHLVGRFEDHAWTPFDGVFRLPPGHALVVDERGPKVERYWDVDPEYRVRFRSEGAYADAFRDLFRRAVIDRLRSERPVGVLLSGGVDSGAVASMAGLVTRERGDDPSGIHTYSWALRELHQVDERAVSDQIVAHYGLTPAAVAADELWPLSRYPVVAPPRNGPFVGVYQELLDQALDQAVADGVGVVLSGNRGDLLTGERVPDVVGLALNGRWRDAVDDIRYDRRRRRASTIRTIDRLLLRPAVSDLLARPPLSRRTTTRRAGGSTIRAAAWVAPALLTEADLASRPPRGFDAPVGLLGSARRERYRAVFSGMQIATMDWANTLYAERGLGFADPWSDRRLAEFVIAAPAWVVQRLTQPKRLAREAMRGVMPETVRRAATKVDPSPLFRRTLEERGIALIEDLLSAPRMAELGFVDPAPLRQHYARIRAGEPAEATFWWALSLEMWLRRWRL